MLIFQRLATLIQINRTFRMRPIHNFEYFVRLICASRPVTLSITQQHMLYLGSNLLGQRSTRHSDTDTLPDQPKGQFVH